MRGVGVTVLEASDGVGGRVRTDVIDGFRCDRGFQIHLTAYPEVSRQLDVAELRLQRFEPGAVVRVDAGFHRVVDPRRRWRDAEGVVETVRAPVGSLLDRARLLRLVRDVTSGDAADLFRRDECSTLDDLRRRGFSEPMIERLFRPLFAGIQLDPDLEVTSRRFEMILRMLADGEAAVPADGMEAIPAQLAAGLPEGTLRLGTRPSPGSTPPPPSPTVGGWRDAPSSWPPRVPSPPVSSGSGTPAPDPSARSGSPPTRPRCPTAPSSSTVTAPARWRTSPSCRTSPPPTPRRTQSRRRRRPLADRRARRRRRSRRPGAGPPHELVRSRRRELGGRDRQPDRPRPSRPAPPHHAAPTRDARRRSVRVRRPPRLGVHPGRVVLRPTDGGGRHLPPGRLSVGLRRPATVGPRRRGETTGCGSTERWPS